MCLCSRAPCASLLPRVTLTTLAKVGPSKVIGGEVWGGRRRGAETWRRAVVGYSLSTRQTDGAQVAVEEDAAAMAKLLLVTLVAKSSKVVRCRLAC